MSRIENPTVDGLNTAVTLRTSSGMNTPPAHESAVSATGNHYSSSYHYSPAPNYHATHNPTFVYHAAPPVDASHGRVVYMFGIFKIACYSVMFFSCMYVGYHVVSNLHHDMVSKIESYESGNVILNLFLICTNSVYLQIFSLINCIVGNNTMPISVDQQLGFLPWRIFAEVGSNVWCDHLA